MFNWIKQLFSSVSRETETVESHYKLGANREDIDYRDITVDQLPQLVKDIPDYHLTSLSMIPVTDQKNNGSCFVRGTLVQLINGEFREIQDITVGNEILDAYSKPQKVTKLFHRTFQGNMYEIYPYGLNIPIKTTPEHPFLMKDGSFKEAKDLKTTDNILIPINTKVVDKTDFWYEKDPDFLRVLGLFLAEGNIDKSRVCFTMASHEEDVIDYIATTIYRIFGIIGYKNKLAKRLNIRFSNKSLADIFIKNCKTGSINKRIHEKFLTLDPKLQYHILYGWLLGDGSFKDKKQIIGVSISKELVLQLFFISLRNRLIPNIRVRKAYGIHKEAYNLEFNSTDCNRIFPEKYTKTKRRKEDHWRGYFNGNYLVRRIRKINKIIPSKEYKFANGVYNIETTGSHTYTANFVAVHNCVGHAEGTYIEHLNYRELNGKSISRRFVYANCKRFDGTPEEGTQPRVASAVLRNFGATTSDYIPDDNSLPHNSFIDIQKSGTPYEIAKKYRIHGYALIRNVDAESLKRALVQYGLVTVSLPVDWNTGWLSKTGFLNKEPLNIIGYHRIILYGYSTHDGETIFNFRNSWGYNWGKSGNGTFLYSKYAGKIYDARVYTDIPKELLDNAKDQKYMFTKTLRVGDTGNDVRELQKVLGIEQNGLFDEFMKEQVALYQTLHSLSADGIVGPKTREMLNGIVVDGYKPSVKDVAEAIKIHEGWFKGSRSQRNNNPGNLRFAGQPGAGSKDSKGFAVFKTYEDGFAALCRLITNAKEGKSKVYKPEMTLLEFFGVYAPSFDHNDPNAYAKFVAQKCKCSIDLKIKELV